MKAVRIVIITGMAGSGKSTVMRALEDIGFYCVDNLPVVLLPKFLSIQAAPELSIAQVALVMDLREKRFLDQYQRIFKRLKQQGYTIEILFLDSTDDVLVNRFSETRRVHPLSPQGTVMEGIRLEREKLAPLKKMADWVVDTTTLNVHQLKDVIQRAYAIEGGMKRLLVYVTSFGYRYGIPVDADIILDVRFLANPYFVADLKPLAGYDPAVRDYVLSLPESAQFVEKMTDLIGYLLPLYEREGKSRLNIALGCTGGRHRSVVMANRLCMELCAWNYPASVHHRDIDKT
ncbi:MAG TPA: RNase adapter RapZ [Syntrophales bacterium]|nr:RNase adapter RapZ [Syntrophales bacterium]